MKCKWTIRSGTRNTFWAYTPCRRGFNYLSRVRDVENIKKEYNGRLCPICGNPIECNTELVEEACEFHGENGCCKWECVFKGV